MRNVVPEQQNTAVKIFYVSYFIAARNAFFFSWTKPLQQFMNAVKCSDISVQQRFSLCNWGYREFTNFRFSAETCLQSSVCELISPLQRARISSQTQPQTGLIPTLSSVGWARCPAASRRTRASWWGGRQGGVAAICAGRWSPARKPSEKTQCESLAHRKDHPSAAPPVRQRSRTT